MKFRYTAILLIALGYGLGGSVLGGAVSAAAQDSFGHEAGPENLTLLEGDSLHSAFSGRTMDGVYKAVRARTGTAHFTETFTSDGRTLYREGPLTGKGRWQLSGPPGLEDIICFVYSGSMAGPESCFTVFRSGTCLYSYHPSLITNAHPIDTNRWSAKTVIRGELSSCDDLIS